MTSTERTARFAPDLASVRAGRHFVRDVLESWGLEQVTDDAQLCASEIVTNAVMHAGTEVTITIRRDADARDLVIEVHDGAPERPVTLDETPVAPDSPNGRGLQIVDAISTDWGSDGTATGKTIWFRLPLPGTGDSAVDADVFSITRRRDEAPAAAPEHQLRSGQARTTG